MQQSSIEILMEIESVLDSKPANLSLLNGYMGQSIFYIQLYKITGELKFLKKCTTLLDLVKKRLSRVQITDSLSSGLTGIMWGIDYINSCSEIMEDDHDLFVDFENLIFNSSLRNNKDGFYDLLHGGLGAAVYALNHLEQENTQIYLNRLLNILDNNKIEDEFGFAWIDPSFHKYVSIKTSKAYKKGSNAFNLGISHGMPAIIEILTRVHKYGLFQEQTEKLITGGLNWIINAKLKGKDYKSIYPNVIYDAIGNYDGNSRLSWCYGDLMLALIFWRSGEVLGNNIWKNEALNIMYNSVDRIDPLENKYLDCCICHGTAGISHIFRKFYLETKNDVFLERAKFWLSQTLARNTKKNGLAGYRTYTQHEFNGKIYHRWKNSTGLLEGITGIGLVITSALNEDTSWDNCLLL